MISKHFPWDRTQYFKACTTNHLAKQTGMNWNLPIQRRHRDQSLKQLLGDHQKFHHWRLHLPAPVNSEFAKCRRTRIWVTCDSVSMLYEALTSGAFVGVLELPTLRVAKTGRKIWRSIESLANSKHVHLSNDGLLIDTLNQKARALNESLRCAKIVARTLLR